MSRHRYRSQPNLQRSGGRTAPAILALCLASGIALGVGALLSPLVTGFSEDSHPIGAVAPRHQPTPRAPAQEAAPVDTPAVAPELETVQANPGPPATPSPPRVAAVQGEASRPPIAKVKARTAVRSHRPAKSPSYPVSTPLTPQEQWERQRLDYEQARHAYDANEREAGYRWAQQNNIRLQRNCRAAEQRTAAFMEGCMNYARGPVKAREPEKPRGSGGSDPPDKG